METGLPDDGRQRRVSAILCSLPVRIASSPREVVMNRRRVSFAVVTSFFGMALLAGCAATPLSRYPDFPKMKPTLGTLAVLGDVTSLVYKSGDIQKLDIMESEQFGSVLLNEMASA